MAKGLLILICIGFSFSMFSQEEDAWVYFVDKEDVANKIANPISILTQEAIDRKNDKGVAIDERDVEVNENYISALKSASGITVKAKSKWFNAAHVRGTEADINSLFTNQESLISPSKTFIDHIVFADNSVSALSKSAIVKQKSKLETELTAFTYGDAQNQIEMFNGDDLHLDDKTGGDMVIAILDAGFPNVKTMSAFQKLRTDGHLLDGYDFVNRDIDVYANAVSNHGTLVLSTMAGYVNTETEKFVGSAPDASYYLFITEDGLSENPVEESYWVEAAERADSLGVDIINTSLGYFDYDPNTKFDYTQSDMDGNTAYITKGANIAFEKGILVVASAGNSGNTGVGAPADAENVLSIGAVDALGNYASFSSIGTAFQPSQKPDVVAQGKGSAVITQYNVISSADGTSFSSPILAGGIACLWQALPDLTNAEIMQLVRESASLYNNPNYQLGYGIPDLASALTAGKILEHSKLKERMNVSVFPNPVSDKLIVNWNSKTSDAIGYLYNVLGKMIGSFVLSKGDNEINMSALTKGFYVLKVDGQSTSNAFKIVKE
ncbi:S8 family serine peptidase [Algibacter pacificus]|uniref:S8 family serine peptidase n=1 Tax=Algibacter pacificus TaxID=2599389 RepID=UPI0011CC2D04|nr:S8 family serine peptidase [Algibacter pacificus]